MATNKLSGRTKGALWLLIGPTALLILTFALFALTNWISVSTMQAPTAGELFGSQPVWVPIVNVILWLVAVLSFIAWLPGLIIGIILLATKK